MLIICIFFGFRASNFAFLAFINSLLCCFYNVILTMSTIRQTMISLLQGQDLSAKEISQIIGLREKEVYDHLTHIARSAAVKGKLIVQPASCRHCGFVFKKRDRLTPPGKCFLCRSEAIIPPRFAIRGIF